MTKLNRPTPWRDVVRLKDELKTGELSLAQFAADLHEVVQAAGKRPVYEDPAKFFALTFPTHALRELVKDVAWRLDARSDKAVRQLELTYGGGKTHTLITLYHLFRDPGSLPDLPAVREFREAVGQELPSAFVASLCFDKIDVERGIEDVCSPAGEHRTLRHPWSVLAYQLAGDDGLRAIHRDGNAEERDVPPAEPLLAKLIARPQKEGLSTLILVDEVLMYARQKAGLSHVWRDRIQDFFQSLVQAVVKVDRAALVASLLATDPSKEQGPEGERLKSDLFNVFRRQKEQGVQPVAKEDVAEVLRRRFFVPGDLAEADSYRHHVIAAVRELGRVDAATKKGTKAEESRFHASYPFHPDLTEVFYGRWTQLNGFQRTRGILRTLAIALREAEEWDPCPVIGPAVLLAAPDRDDASTSLSELAGVATSEPVGGKRTEWKQLLEGELRLARQVQQELPALAPKREVEQAVVAVFLHSQPRGHKAHTPELRKLIGSGSPDAIELDKGLQRWRDISWFLDDDDGTAPRFDGSRQLPKTWRLGNKPNLRQMHDQAVRQRVSPDTVEARLVEAVRKAKGLTEGAQSAGAEVHRLPQRPADVPDDVRFRYVVLGPDAVSDSGKPSATARRFLDEHTGPDKPRVHRNVVVLAVPSREGLEATRVAVRNLLGWEDVQSQLNQGHAVDALQQERLKRMLRDAARRVPETVRHAYGIVVATDTGDRVQAFKLPADGRPLFSQIKDDDRSRIQETPVEPAALLPDGPYHLWREDDASRRVAELADPFARHSRLPKLLKPEVVCDTVLHGVEEGLFVARLVRPDGTRRTFWREPVDPDARRDPGLEAVLPEYAELTRLSPQMLDPEGAALPQLWSGESLPLSGLLAYFGGGKTVMVPKEGFEEPLAVPRCDAEMVREAVASAVELGVVWLLNGPTSLWKEAVPASVLDGDATLRARPERVAHSELLPESLPDAWADGATNGIRLTQALSQARGQAVPWGLLRDGIRAAVATRWLEVVSGEVDCAFDQAGTLKLGRPKAAPQPAQPDQPLHPPGGGAVLEVDQLQDLAELGPDLMEIAAGSGLHFRVSVGLEEELDSGKRAELNRRLVEVSADLKLT